VYIRGVVYYFNAIKELALQFTKLPKIIALLLFFYAASAHAVDTYSKIWASIVQTGPLSKDRLVKYYLDSRLELRDTHNKFEQAYATVGIGYQTSPNVTFFLANMYVVSKRLSGLMQHEYRLWQQANWNMVNAATYNISSRSRLEERWSFEDPGMALRWREQVTLRVPLANWPRHAFVLSDEMFFNINHPEWVSLTVFQQNRLFIGIGTNLSKQTSVDIGYLNQYVFGSTKQFNNVLSINFNVNCG